MDSEITTAVPIITTSASHRATKIREASGIQAAHIRTIRAIRATVVLEIRSQPLKIKTVPELKHPAADSEEVQAHKTTLSKTAVLQDSSPAEEDLDKTIINKKTNS